MSSKLTTEAKACINLSAILGRPVYLKELKRIIKKILKEATK